MTEDTLGGRINMEDVLVIIAFSKGVNKEVST